MTNEFGITLGLSTIGLEKWCLKSRFNEVGSQEAQHSSDHTYSPEPAWELPSQPRRACTLHSKIPRNQSKNKCVWLLHRKLETLLREVKVYLNKWKAILWIGTHIHNRTEISPRRNKNWFWRDEKTYCPYLCVRHRYTVYLWH